MDRLTARRVTCRKNAWCCHHDTPQKLQRAKKKKTLLAFSLLGISLSLTGCMGIYEGGFECPPGEGTKCKSISEVNDLINKGEIPLSGLKVQESDVRCFNAPVCPLTTETPDVLTPDTLTPAIWWAPVSNQGSGVSYQNDPEEQKDLEKKQEIQRNDTTSI